MAQARVAQDSAEAVATLSSPPFSRIVPLESPGGPLALAMSRASSRLVKALDQVRPVCERNSFGMIVGTCIEEPDVTVSRLLRAISGTQAARQASSPCVKVVSMPLPE